MKKLVLFLLLAIPLYSQTAPPGRAFGSNKPTGTCQLANIDHGACITDDMRILVSSDGVTWIDPKNFSTGAQVNITIGPTLTGPPGTAATVTNVGTPQAPTFVFQIPAGNDGKDGKQGLQGPQGIQGVPGVAPKWTTVTCQNFSGKPTIDANGVWTFANATASGCTQQ